jgi:hypothetical protein
MWTKQHLSAETGRIEHMFDTAQTPPLGHGDTAAAPDPAADEVAGLDADATLTRMAEQRRVREALEFDQLALAAHWADLHGHLDGPDAVVLPGAERLIRLGGDGTPAVAEFCPAELAAVLGQSPYAGVHVMADALDLRHRLPILWNRIKNGQVQPWIGRRVAQQTRQLSAVACAVVDRKVASWCARLTWTRLAPVIQAAVLEADPDQAMVDTKAARDLHGVWVDPDTAGTGTGSCFIRADAADLTRFDAALNRIAADLAAVGDDRTRDQRRACAVGVLADPNDTLDLHATAAEAADATCGTARARPTGADARPDAVLYVHLARESLRGADCAAVARVEGIGPLLADTVRDWLTPGPGRRANRITVKPVLDLADQTPVDAYEIPDRIRELVHLRSPADCFPYATNTGRHLDNDHTESYVPPANGGPPGQTGPANLGKLTRHHHRIKTHSGWDVKQPFPGLYLWRSPHGRHFLVDHTGTRRLN